MSILTPLLISFSSVVHRGVYKQAVLGEVLAQALASGMGVDDAFKIAARTLRGSRMRHKLQKTASLIRAGHGVRISTIMARLPLHPDLRAAMEVGEERGNLEVEIAAAAGRLDPLVGRHLEVAVGRSPMVNPFAVALARLLVESPFTVRLMRDAARLVDGGDRRFRATIDEVANDLESGSSFAEALARQHRFFDVLFVSCVARADSRESLRRILLRLSTGTHGA